MSEERTRWGFHRLTDQAARRLVATARVCPDDLVVDIGAGTGAITAHLVAANARVIAVELHPRRAAILRERFGARVTVVRADAADLRLPRRPFRVVANPPFAVTVAVLRRLTAPGSRLVRADLVVPAHIAERWTSGRAPGDRRWRSAFAAHHGGHVPSRAFAPPGPPAAVLIIERRAAVHR